MLKTVSKCLIATIACCGVGSAVAQEFSADSTLRGEQLFPYDDQDPWKHGYIQVMPFYGGYHSFRPYNYKHVYAQSAQAAQWGIAAQAPYSQQFWHQYERRVDLSMTEFAPGPQAISPAGYDSSILAEPAPAPPAVQYTPQTQYYAPAAPQYQGYPQSPQYNGQLWAQPTR